MTQDKVASVVLVLSSRAMPHGKKGTRLQVAYPSNKVWTQLKFMGPSTPWVSHKNESFLDFPKQFLVSLNLKDRGVVPYLSMCQGL